MNLNRIKRILSFKVYSNSNEIISEIQLLNESVDSLQKSVANLRNDIPIMFRRMMVDAENRRIIT